MRCTDTKRGKFHPDPASSPSWSPRGILMVLNAQATYQLLDQYVVYIPCISGSAQLCHTQETGWELLSADKGQHSHQLRSCPPHAGLWVRRDLRGAKHPEHPEHPQSWVSSTQLEKDIQILLIHTDDLRAVKMPLFVSIEGCCFMCQWSCHNG